MEILSKLLVTLHPHRAPFVDNMQRSKQKVKKNPFSGLPPQEPLSVLLKSQVAPEEQGRCSLGALPLEESRLVLLRSLLSVGTPQDLGLVLLRSTLGWELRKSQGRCCSGAAAKGASC